MAKATVTCTCKKCGNAFVKSSVFPSRAQADAWELWAVGHYDMCSDCFGESKAYKEAIEYGEKRKKYDLPDIKGVSSKQIEYAEGLRKKRVCGRNHIDTLIELMENIDEKALEKMAEDSGKGKEQYIQDALKEDGLFPDYVCLYISDARIIIDALK